MCLIAYCTCNAPPCSTLLPPANTQTHQTPLYTPPACLCGRLLGTPSPSHQLPAVPILWPLTLMTSSTRPVLQGRRAKERKGGTGQEARTTMITSSCWMCHSPNGLGLVLNAVAAHTPWPTTPLCCTAACRLLQPFHNTFRSHSHPVVTVRVPARAIASEVVPGERGKVIFLQGQENRSVGQY